MTKNNLSLQYVLLNKNYLSHKKDFAIFFLSLICGDTSVNWANSRYAIDIDWLEIKKTNKHMYQCGARTLNKYIGNYVQVYGNHVEYAGKIVVLTKSTLSSLLNRMANLSAAEQNGILRTYCYFVCQCWEFQDFSRSQEKIAEDLDNRVVDVIRRIHWLVDNKFIAYKHKHQHFGEINNAAVYQLYRDAVPDHYANKMWFIGQLAEPASINVDDILAEYSNNFIKKP